MKAVGERAHASPGMAVGGLLEAKVARDAVPGLG